MLQCIKGGLGFSFFGVDSMWTNKRLLVHGVGIQKSHNGLLIVNDCRRVIREDGFFDIDCSNFLQICLEREVLGGQDLVGYEMS
jgi:hypothetical protein